MMTNKQILEIAMKQSAVDSSCDWQDFTKQKNKVVVSKKSENARKYLELPFLCDLTTYGANLVASVSPEFGEIAADYISRFPVEHCFETPNLHVLMERLRPLGVNVCFMAEYSLPDVDLLSSLHLTEKLQRNYPYQIRILGPDAFSKLYTEQWGNALCEKRKELDVLAVGAFDGERLIGLAGASADCQTMWQIGVDVLPEYRRRGIASALTNQLALKILERDIVPFYCCAWSNLGSIRNAVASGFRPAWVQLTVKKWETIEDMNQ